MLTQLLAISHTKVEVINGNESGNQTWLAGKFSLNRSFK